MFDFLELLQSWTKTCADEGFPVCWSLESQDVLYSRSVCSCSPLLPVCVWRLRKRLRNLLISTPFFTAVLMQLCICSSVIWKFISFAMGFLSSSSPQSFFQRLRPKPLCSLETHWCVGHTCQFSFRVLYWISPDHLLIRIWFFVCVCLCRALVLFENTFVLRAIFLKIILEADFNTNFQAMLFVHSWFAFLHTNFVVSTNLTASHSLFALKTKQKKKPKTKVMTIDSK